MVVAFTTIGSLIAFIIIAKTQPESLQDARQVCRIEDETKLHAGNQHYAMMTNAVQGITLFALVAHTVASKIMTTNEIMPHYQIPRSTGSWGHRHQTRYLKMIVYLNISCELISLFDVHNTVRII